MQVGSLTYVFAFCCVQSFTRIISVTIVSLASSSTALSTNVAPNTSNNFNITFSKSRLSNQLNSDVIGFRNTHKPLVVMEITIFHALSNRLDDI